MPLNLSLCEKVPPRCQTLQIIIPELEWEFSRENEGDICIKMQLISLTHLPRHIREEEKNLIHTDDVIWSRVLAKDRKKLSDQIKVTQRK